MIIFRKSLTDLWNFNGLSFLTKISQNMQESGVAVVKEPQDANIGLKLGYHMFSRSSDANNGPYSIENENNLTWHSGISVTEYRHGKEVSLRKYDNKNPTLLSDQILKDINCI
jgi:hypothetical protein